MRCLRQAALLVSHVSSNSLRSCSWSNSSGVVPLPQSFSRIIHFRSILRDKTFSIKQPFPRAASRIFGIMSTTSQIRQNFHEESEKGVNKQINMELYASYVYLSMSYYFDRDDVALHGFAKYFKEMSDEEREHAQKLMKFQNQRGGNIILGDVKRPAQDDWTSPLAAMEAALALEKKVNQSLLDLHKVASDHVDPQMCDFLETHYLTEQVESIKQIADHITNLKRVGTGLGEYIFDKKFSS